MQLLGSLHIGDQAYLYLSLAILLSLPFLLLIFRKRASAFKKALFLRGLALACLCLAIGGIYLSQEEDTLSLPLLLDVSDSLDESLAQSLLSKAAGSLSSTSTLKILPFASKTNKAFLTKSVANYSSIKDSNTYLNIGQSNIESALRSALRKGEKDIALLSDGFETTGSVESILPLLKKSGIKIYPLIPEQFASLEESIRIINIKAPFVAKNNQPFNTSVSIKNSLDSKSSGTLTVKLNEEIVYSENVEFESSEERRIDVVIPAVAEGIQEIKAEFTPERQNQPKSSQRTFVSGEKREKVLLLTGQKDEGKYIDQVLKDQQFQLNHLYAPDFSERDLDNLSDYSVIIFNNIGINQIPSTFPSTVKNLVKSGTGFIMIGGNNSFGLGGYKGTSIEDILPVTLVPPRKENKRLNIAVQLVLDKSGSMKERGKIDYSKSAASGVIDKLNPDDYLGIIGFDSTPFELLPMDKVGYNRSKAKKRVHLMFPGTTTNLLPALDLGRQRLEAAHAGRKHMIILTDGKIPDGPARRPYYLQTVDGMRRTGITVSTFMIGSEQDVILREIAEVGGGAFHRTLNAMSLPRLFIEDIKVSTGEQTQKESERFDVKKGNGSITSTSLDAFPVIRGYVQTKKRNRANLELVAYANRQAEPLLASWDVEQGKSIAFTSDVSGRWSYYWVGWPRFRKFWNDLVQAARSSSVGSKTDIDFEFRPYLKGDTLYVDTTIFNTEVPNSLSLIVEKPDKSKLTLPLKSLALGHFQSEIESASAGIYNLTLQSGNTSLTPVAFALSGELFGEKQGKGYNTELLNRIAAYTGGVVNPSKSVLNNIKPTKSQQKLLRNWFLAAALFLLIFEIIVREVGLRILKRKYS